MTMAPGRIVALQLLFWAAAALALAALLAASEVRELYWLLAALTFGGWWLARSRWR
ncbi:MAG: hypothetical protein ACT4P3_00835 [Betaproteobacteria bacterium]